MKYLSKSDPQVAKLIRAEEKRQSETLMMIPSENYASKAVHEAVGSVFMHKYAEGQVKARYYEGNKYADEVEQLAKDRVRKAFKLPQTYQVNVQALAGSNANLGVFNGLLQPGDKILSMYLPDGGHLSHGWSFEPDKSKRASSSLVYRGGSRKVSIVSKFWQVVQYKTDPKTEVFDYDQIEKLALKEKPQLIITGGTAYPREINYRRVAQIAHKVKALYLADIAHEAGIILGGANKSPVGLADVITFTTHKTFRGPRGAVVFTKNKYAEAVDRGIFPCFQGGPFLHSMAGIAVAAKEASTPKFKKYAFRIVKNCKALAKALQKRGFYLISGGTDKHLLLIDILRSKQNQVKAKYIARALDYAGLVLNKSTIPWETGTPINPSGIRMGTPIVTSRGMKEKQMEFVADLMVKVIKYLEKYKDLTFKAFDKKCRKDKFLAKKAREVKELCKKFPVRNSY
jgi:glycine hydroxymethyltransferase